MTVGHNGGPPIREGNWIAISREMIEHHIVGAGNMVTPADKNRGSFSRLESWLDLLSMANYAERKITVAGATLVLRPGQTLAGRAFLAKRWNWTEKAVRVWLAKLEAELMITLACEKLKEGQAKGHGPNVLSVCNWGKYQVEQESQGPDLGMAVGPPKGHTITKEQDNNYIPTLAAAVSRPAALPASGGLQELQDKLLGACNGALDNPANCQGLLSLSIPQMWLAEGADLELDVLPTLKAIGQRDHGKRIKSWSYFTGAISQAVAQRKAGLSTRKTRTPMGSDWSEIAKKARETEGRQ